MSKAIRFGIFTGGTLTCEMLAVWKLAKAELSDVPYDLAAEDAARIESCTAFGIRLLACALTCRMGHRRSASTDE